MLEIGRQARPKLYDLQFQKPQVLVPRELRLGAAERLAADGTVLTGVAPSEIRSISAKSRAPAHPDAIAICFLVFAFAIPGTKPHWPKSCDRRICW